MAAIKVKSHSDKVKNKGMAPPSGPKRETTPETAHIHIHTQVHLKKF